MTPAVLIIGSSKGAPTDDDRAYYNQYVQFFQQSATQQAVDVELVTALVEDLIIEVGDGVFRIYDTRNNRELTRYKALIIRGGTFKRSRDIVETISEFGRQYHTPVINEGRPGRNASKLLQAVHFQCMDIPVARTLNVNTALLAHMDAIAEWAFPCIMKARSGSHGNDNYVVHSLEEVREIYARDKNIGYVLQRFVPNDGDYRILLVGSEVLVIQRVAQGDSHLNNTSQGGSAREVDSTTLPPLLIEQSRQIADYYNLEIAGVDAIQDKETGDYFFLEVNVQPQLMTGALIEKKRAMVGALLKRFTDER